MHSAIVCPPKNFNPRPREGGDLLQRLSARNCQIISIHAPREGGDTVQNRLSYGTERFQSTPPARGATTIYYAYAVVAGISIHAPREGGDFPKPSILIKS